MLGQKIKLLQIYSFLDIKNIQKLINWDWSIFLYLSEVRLQEHQPSREASLLPATSTSLSKETLRCSQAIRYNLSSMFWVYPSAFSQ